jgi:PPM family protein phosphatase
MTLLLQPSADNRKIRTASLSLQGKRSSNQDRILLFQSDSASNLIVAAVADGLGGMQDGDKAAEIAIQTVKETADELNRGKDLSFTNVSDLLADLYERANARIRKHAEAAGKVNFVGTTLTTVVLSGSSYVIAHIGDTRCYLIEDSGVRQMTQDHTLADELLRQGSLSEHDYNESPFRNQLTRSLGPKETCEADITPGVEYGHLAQDCAFLLCSDGFYSRLENSDLSRLLASSTDLQNVLDSLASEALHRRTSDNLSAIAVRRSQL